MKCKLCLQEKPLLKKSHIAPNFLYKELKDEKNTFVKGHLDEKKAEIVQSGLYEANLLCQDCDNRVLGGLENYASKILYGGNIKSVSLKGERNQHGVESIVCNGIDYSKFKLFLLSLIWRFSIARSDFYSKVNLGEHEEKIRKMIFEGDAGNTMDYPCAITSYRNNIDLPTAVISQPLPHKHDESDCYSFLMCGFLYTFYITDNPIPDFVSELVVKSNGELRIVQMPRENGLNLLRNYFGLDVHR